MELFGSQKSTGVVAIDAVLVGESQPDGFYEPGEQVVVQFGIKNATATNTFKPAKMETGITVQVPPFINKGEKIKIDTAEGKYMERA